VTQPSAIESQPSKMKNQKIKTDHISTTTAYSFIVVVYPCIYIRYKLEHPVAARGEDRSYLQEHISIHSIVGDDDDKNELF
jgi:hypothetical protein